MRRNRVVIALLALAFVLAGCTSLPTSGDVHRGVEAGPNEGLGYVVADDPQPGAGPTEIVRGFQSAAVAGNTDDFITARKFLDTSNGAEWDPSAQVVIYDGASPVSYSQTEEDTVTITVTVVATVDASGIYTEAAPGTTTTLTYHLVKDDDGQWRIDQLPKGVLMSEVNFGTLYRKTPLYFIAASGEALVPELRWYPQRNSATYVMRGLINGPSEWLSPAVVSALPAGTGLSIDSVTVSGGVATVPLNQAVQAASAKDRALLISQIQATLTALPQIRSVRITVDDVQLKTNGPVPDLTKNQTLQQPLTVLTAQDQLAKFNGSEESTIESVPNLRLFKPSAPAVAYGSDFEAVMLAGKSSLVTVPNGDDKSVTLLQGKDLVAPSYGPRGWIWTGEKTNNRGQLLLARAGGETHKLKAPSLEHATLRAIRVSRDGARVAMIVEKQGQVQVLVHAVIRDGDGIPTELGTALRVGRSLSDATDLAWVSETSLAVLGISKTALAVHEVEVGGRSTALPSVNNTVGVAGGDGMRDVYLLTKDGRLFGRSGNGWAAVADGVRALAFPG